MLDSYENSLKISRNLKAEIDYAYEKGKQEGMLEAKSKVKTEVATALKDKGISTAIITKVTGLSVDEIQKL